MVNCKNCGAPLSLDDAYCPHCGTPNPEAQEHIEKLAKLNKDFNKAKSEVKEEVKKSKQGYNVLVILVMILLANIVLVAFHGAEYDIAERVIASKMSDKQIMATLEQMLESKEYIEMSVFMDKYYLPYDKYGDYNRVAYLAEYYDRIIENVTLYFHAEDPYSDPLVRACQSIKDFDDEYTRLLKWNEDDRFAAHYDNIYKEYSTYLKRFLKLTDEDIAQISDMSNSELLIRINGRLNDEE